MCIFVTVPTNASSYKSKLINLIIENNIIKSYIRNCCYFADLDFDGKMEFITVENLQLSQCTVYYMKNSKLVKASGIFYGPSKGYYDTKNQKYLWLNKDARLLRSGIYSYEAGNIINTFSKNKGKVTSNMYSSRQSELVDSTTSKYVTTYYKGSLFDSNKKITKSAYKKLNKSKTKNLINAKTKIKLLETYGWDSYSISKIKSELSKSYEAFSYKKIPKLNRKTVTLKKGKTFKLKIKNKKGKASFTSSNKKVVKVDKNGKITAKKRGKVTVTVKNRGVKIKCKVIVK